ncbi:MAG: ABC transporter substrate-binding protein [Chloroflexi bacterium]|nr:ABC transporter substrate-binding protein [Chloroflexota bacterium]MYD49001.1 ABC transporter substrate-binding protein [Chloroflexota bacterium]
MSQQVNSERIRLRVAFRNMFYTTIYVAVEGGFLAEQGLDVDFDHIPAGQSSTDLLKAGEIDITQSGISRSFMDLDAGSDAPPLHVAEINQRDGFFLLSRRPTDGWTWADLIGATLIPVGFTPVPYTTLQAAMRWHGVDPASVNLMAGLSAEEMLGRFRNGDADYLQVPYPFAGQLVDEGSGHIAVTLGTESGYVCYSSFAVTPAYLAENPETVQRFVNGYARAQRWVAESEPEAVAERIASMFPEYDRALLADGVRRYKGAGVWATDPMIGRNGFDRMRDALIAGGLVEGAHPYESIVRPEFAEQASAELV